MAVTPPAFRSGTFWHVYLYAIPNGVLLAGPAVVDSAAEIQTAAENFGEKITVDLAQAAHGITLVYQGGRDRVGGVELLEALHNAGREQSHHDAAATFR